MTSLPMENVTSGLPKVMLGGDGLSIKKPNDPKEPIPPKPFPTDDKDIDKTMEETRKWGLRIIVGIVMIYAAYRLISSFIGG